MPRVRLIDEGGEQLGIKPTAEALEYAYAKGLDLVEVAAQADPPVARVMDYGKYRYEQEQKAKLARKHQSQIHVKEIKLRPKIGIHDYETKKGHVVRFLGQRAKVKVTIMFRGRETLHPERGRDLLMRLAEDVAELGQIEKPAGGGREEHGHGARADEGRRQGTGGRRCGTRSSERNRELEMPKQKSSSSAKKRFKVTGTGKIMRRHAMESHNLGRSRPSGSAIRARRGGRPSDVREGGSCWGGVRRCRA